MVYCGMLLRTVQTKEKIKNKVARKLAHALYAKTRDTAQTSIKNAGESKEASKDRQISMI